MAKDIVVTPGKGTVSGTYTADPNGVYPTYSVSVQPDDNSGELSVTTPANPNLKKGDKVSFTVSEGPAGRLLGNVEKI